MDPVAVVAFTRVGPVRKVHAAVRRWNEIQSTKPSVAYLHQVRSVTGHVAGPLAFQVLVIEPATVEIDGEQLIAERFRPVVALVDEQARVGMATTQGITPGGELAAVEGGTRLGPAGRGVEVEVIGVLFDERVGVRVHVIAVHPPEVRPGNGVPEMADDGVDEEGFSLRVPIESPRIGGAMTDGLNDVPLGMIAPDATPHLDAGRFGTARAADVSPAGDADAAPEPAVRSPFQTVGKRMPVSGGGGESVQQHLWLPRRLIGSRFHWNEEQLRRTQHKHAASSQLQARENGSAIPEHRPPVESPVVIGVFENHHAVA